MKKNRILIVDDDPVVLESCQRILSDRDYLVTCISDAGEAISHLTSPDYHLVILDVKMPVKSGINLIDIIKQNKSTDKGNEPKILAMSGYATPDTILSLKTRGVNAFIEKPFTPDEFLDKIRNILEPAIKETGDEGL
jgi:CheY-like chemotaxis protein